MFDKDHTRAKIKDRRRNFLSIIKCAEGVKKDTAQRKGGWNHLSGSKVKDLF